MITAADAAADLKWMIEGDFSVAITVTNPSGKSAVLRGQQNDIGKQLDQETGAIVTGRSASVSLSLASLAAEGLGEPYGVVESSSRPWIIEFTTPSGSVRKFKVRSIEPDQGGVIVCFLEAYS